MGKLTESRWAAVHLQANKVFFFFGRGRARGGGRKPEERERDREKGRLVFSSGLYLSRFFSRNTLKKLRVIIICHPNI